MNKDCYSIVFTFLDNYRDLSRAAITSKMFLELSQNNVLWKRLCEKDNFMYPVNSFYYNKYKICFILDRFLNKYKKNLKDKFYDSSLCLSYKTLSVLPAEIGALTNLQNLWLNNNKLSEIPAEIGALTNLQYLYLNNNELSVLPAEIGALTNLQTLSLHNNKLSVLPAEIGALTNLQYLYLNNNELSVLPAEINTLTNLRSIPLFG